MKFFIQNSYLRIGQTGNKKYILWLLFATAFADSSVLPLPVTTMFVILSVPENKMAFKFAFYVTLGTIAGAISGYLIGRWAWLTPSAEFTGFAKTIFNNIPGFTLNIYNKIDLMYNKWDYKILIAAIITPIPYCLFSISSGIFGINIVVFFLVTSISHAVKYLFLAIITNRSGNEVRKLFFGKLKRIAVRSESSV